MKKLIDKTGIPANILVDMKDCQMFLFCYYKYQDKKHIVKGAKGLTVTNIRELYQHVRKTKANGQVFDMYAVVAFNANKECFFTISASGDETTKLGKVTEEMIIDYLKHTHLKGCPFARYTKEYGEKLLRLL